MDWNELYKLQKCFILHKRKYVFVVFVCFVLLKFE